MSFLQGSIDLFSGRRVSHMGSYQYVAHAGKRDGKSMSGAELWAEIEAAELNSNDPNLFSAEETLLRKVSQEIEHQLPAGTPVLEMGTGTPNAFRKKTQLIMRAIHSNEYICVDESRAFLNELIASTALSGINVYPIEDDFFEGDPSYFNDIERDALICMFGSTIGNIVAPLNNQLPERALIEHLNTMAHAINNGYLLLSFDANQNGEKIVFFYEKQELFQLNTFYRMAAELPIQGNFDPQAFEYEATWIPSLGQLAHMAVVTRNMDFTLVDTKISLRKNQRLHLKNSFKFTPAFFEHCCSKAGLDVIKSWTDESLTHVYLLGKQPHITVLPQQTLLTSLRA